MMRVAFILLAIVFLAGCFPIAYHVDGYGRVLIPRQEGYFVHDLAKGETTLLARPRSGTPVWARWSPDGQLVLMVEIGRDGLLVMQPETGVRKSLGRFTDICCALWSPDSEHVSVVLRVGNRQVLKVVSVRSGRVRQVLDPVLTAHDWLPDGRLLALRPVGEATGGKRVEVVAIHPEVREPQVVAEVVCRDEAVIDASPNGQSALLVEQEVVPPADPDKRRVPRTQAKLVEIDMARATKTVLPVENPMAAFYRPDGQRLMIVTADGKIIVTYAQGQWPREVATGAATRWRKCPFYPTWVDDDSVLYGVVHDLPGTENRWRRNELHLVRTRIDGTGTTDFQTGIDAAAAKVGGVAR